MNNSPPTPSESSPSTRDTHSTSASLASRPYHRDPFDRLLVSQAVSERLTLINADSQINQYPMEVVW